MSAPILSLDEEFLKCQPNFLVPPLPPLPSDALTLRILSNTFLKRSVLVLLNHRVEILTALFLSCNILNSTHDCCIKACIQPSHPQPVPSLFVTRSISIPILTGSSYTCIRQLSSVHFKNHLINFLTLIRWSIVKTNNSVTYVNWRDLIVAFQY